MDIIWLLTILATLFLHGSSIPQFVRNYKRKKTDDISLGLWFMVFVGYIFMMIISLLTNNSYFKIIYGLGILNICALIIQILYYRGVPINI